MPDVKATKTPITWTRAYALGIGIALYFMVATVWLPSFVLRLPIVASADSMLRDLIGSGVWVVFLVAGLVVLRLAQRARLI